MRLVGKLTAGMGLGICGVMAVHAWLRVEREARFIETDMAERHVQSGRAVALAVDAAWRLGGDAEVATLLARVSATPRAPAVTWHVAPDGAAPPAPSGGVVHDMVADGGDGRLVTTLPLSAAPHGHLTISESLTREKQYLRATVAGEVVTGFLLFYLVRGDSAQILPGFGAPDSTRWWIQQMDDETIPPSGLRALPAPTRTYGALKHLYRSYLRLPT